MRLLTGPAGSGKTTFILNSLREALRAGDQSVRLLVPTATLARHLQNQIAREGFVFHRDVIQTLNAFVETWAGELPQVPDTVVYLMVEEAARRVDRPEFARVAGTPGFYASLTRTITELASAGCDSARLADHLPDAPLADAFLAVYQELDRMLDDRGLSLRARRLEFAAERIALSGAGGIRAIWLDGFHALPDPELRVIGALAEHTELTLALRDADLTGPVRARLDATGFHRQAMPRVRPSPALALVRAGNMERECDEIARRIIEQASAGRPFREMAIVVRAADPYVPLLRSTLDRFGIPAHFYFDERLDEEAPVRFLTSVVDAMLSGWDYAATLAVLRLAPRFADSNALDRFDFAVREQIPNAGLGGLKALADAPGSESLANKLTALGEIEEWRQFTLTPRGWAVRLRLLRNLFRPTKPDLHRGRAEWSVWRTQAAALDQFDKALDEAAESMDARQEMPLEVFWHAVKAVVRLKPMRLVDSRRDLVHVLSAHEARQWVLPVVFVCGLVEKVFPQFHAQDPFLPDSARTRLNTAGIRVRTAGEMEREERALFDSAVTSAALLVTLSYPETDSRGERNLRSAFLEDRVIEEQKSRAVRPRPRAPYQALAAPAGIHAPRLLQVLRERTARVSPTSLETYLQCPFQYFGSRLLRLKPPPLRPEERLDFLTQGNIVHEVLANWYGQKNDIVPLFEEIFARQLEEKQIPAGYHTERLRNAMLDDLLAFTRAEPYPAGAFHSRMEEKFEFALDETLAISGKIDRLDETDDKSAYVVDYKYSNAQNTKGKKDNPNLLQAPLYLLAVEKFFGLKPLGMYYMGLKGGIERVGWELVEEPPGWLDQALARTFQIVSEIRSGRADVAPSDRDKCRFCDCADVCRIDVGQPAVTVEGA